MIAMPEFVHLHVHSHFTLLNSPITIGKLLANVAKKGMTQVALTDRGNLFGAFEFYMAGKDLAEKAAKAAKESAAAPDDGKLAAAAAKAAAAVVTPILGCQLNVTPGAMTEKVRDWQQLVVLATSEKGYRNLSQLVSRGWLQGFYFEPRVDLEAIRELNEDLICLTGAGRWGFLNSHILKGAKEDAATQLGRLKDIFGDRLYVELADLGPDPQLDWHQLIADNVALANAAGVPVVATNWVHYLDAADATIHDVQLAIEGATTVIDTRRKKMPTEEFYLKTGDEMAARFADYPQAISNTCVIAERCHGKIPSGQYFLPTFPCPEGKNEDGLLRELCELGMVQRYGQEGISEAHRERLEFELKTIISMGFPAYFLIVADFIGWAKRNGIPVGPGRGSAAGSLVAYAMGITDMCPLKYGLLFERFLNPGRKSMPDIDVDFCKDRREEVINYVRQKYGEAAVTNIMTLGTMKAKMAIKDVARAYEWSPEESQALANLVPADPSGKTDLKVCLGLKPLDEKKNEFATVAAMKSRYDEDERTRRVLDGAMQLEKLGRNLGVHACGIIIAPGPVSTFVPVCKVKDKHATQFNMSQVEKAGLLKMDFLGLKTMSILKKACTLVQETDGITVDLLQIPLADPKTFALLGTGRTLGVFQCESRGFQELIARLKPDRFEDMIALVALYRPGPLMANMHIDYCDRKHGLQKVTYPHPVLEQALKETYGLYIYQEQVMTLSRELCGFSPAEADDLRKAMGKKDLTILEKLKEKFINGAWDKWQFDKGVCAKMWESILGFASYCFNKSHSACYGLIAYWTAWFKANHYAAFMTANLIYEMGDKDKMTLFVEELKSQQIPVLPPDVNESGWEFTVVRRQLSLAGVQAEQVAIRFGFGGVKGVGEGAAAHLQQVRASGGPFTSLYDLCERTDSRTINKRVVEAAIKVGAFDALHGNRRALYETMDKAFDRGQRVAKTKAQKQETLFATFEQDASFMAATQGYPEVSDWDMTERLRYEKELTGYWMSMHPVAVYAELSTRYATTTAGELPGMAKGDQVAIAAVVVGKRVVKTKTGRFMAILQLEDASGRFEAVLFPGRPNRKGQFEPGPFEKFGNECEDDLVALFIGSVEFREQRRASRPPGDGGDEEILDPAAVDGDEDGGVIAQEEQMVRMPSLQVTAMIPMGLVPERLTRDITIAWSVARMPAPTVVAEMENLFKENDGDCPVTILVHVPDGVALTLALGDKWKVRATAKLIGELQRLWGSEQVILHAQDPLLLGRQERGYSRAG
jgi:DNA polymerase-3 subunit alpha